LVATIFYIDTDLPGPGVSSGENRAVSIVAALAKFSSQFVVLSYRHGLAYIDSQDPIPLTGRLVSELGSRIPGEVVVWASRPPSWNLARHVLCGLPKSRLIFDTVDFHRRRALKGIGLGRNLMQAEAVGLLFETAALSRAAAVAAVTEKEAEELSQLNPRVAVVPNPIRMHKYQPDDAQGKSLGFVGNWQHQPNVDGMQWFLSEVWPQVRSRHPDASLHLAGSGSPPEKLANHPEVVWHGQTPDLEAFYSTLVGTIAPLRFGAGLKGKVAESYGYGRAMVGTSVAAEGYKAASEWMLIADSAQGTIAHCDRLLTSAALRRQLVDRGRQCIQEQYPENLDASVLTMLDLARV
jgi:glycosyltransferase involved in cell wall biosynthesis